MDLQCLSEGIQKISSHASICKGKCSIHRESVREGLASILEVTCENCTQKISVESSAKIEGSNEVRKRYGVNVGAVWGQMATGGGQKCLNETMASINVPGMTKKTFQKIETQIGESWEKVLGDEIKKAGEKEKQLAIQRNDFHHGYPAISVTIDGGWSKRSHKHSYNAMAGVAVIIGCATNKILYVGIRNKFCSICAVAHNKGVSPPNHNCYRNWKGSSGAMESDILVCGFNAAEKMHGIRYMRVVGDGDSSVMSNIQTQVLGWGPQVQCTCIEILAN